CGVGRRLSSAPLSHTWNLQEKRIQLRERPITQRDASGRERLLREVVLKSCVGTRGDRAKPGTQGNKLLARILIPNFSWRNRISKAVSTDLADFLQHLCNRWMKKVFPSQTPVRGCYHSESEFSNFPEESHA